MTGSNNLENYLKIAQNALQAENYEEAKEYANKYIDTRTEVRELEPKVIKAGGYTNSLHKNSSEYIAAREKHKQLKKEFSRLKGLERSYNSSLNNYMNRKVRLQKNQELLK
jgi:predicted  nucleic acid-binding Zn-ribbon protein